MRDTSQRSFNPTQNNGHIAIRFFAALAIDQSSAVWALAANITGRIGIITSDFSICRVTVDHRIHIASSHTEK